MSNINKNVNKVFDLQLKGCNYWDLYLSMDKSSDCFVCDSIISGDVVATFEFDNTEKLCSTVSWESASVSIDPLCDIGLTGYDNRFVDWWTGETFDPSGDTTFCITRVSGETFCYEMNYMPPYGVEPEHVQFCGGFFQGFYRLHEYDYNVLPNMYYKGWTKEFWIKRSPCFSGETVVITGETITFEETTEGIVETVEIWEALTVTGESCEGRYTLNEVYPDNKGIFYYWGLRAENKFCMFSPFSGLTTCTGIPLAPEVEEIPFQPDINPFLYYTRRQVCNPTGSTNPTGKFVDCCDGIINNAMAFRITDEGEVGVRIMTTTGECTLVGDSIQFVGTPIVEEFYSKESIITENKWFHVTYRFRPYETTECIGYRVGSGELSIFVDGFLKAKVDGFPEFIPYELQEHPDKQLGVPFNISIGGGTQGLLESYTFSGLTEGIDLTGYTACNYVTTLVETCTFNGIVINGQTIYSPPLKVSEPELIQLWLEMNINRRHGEIVVTPTVYNGRNSIKIEANAVLDDLQYMLLPNGMTQFCKTYCIDIPAHNGRCGYLEDNFAGSFIGGIGEFRLHERPLCLQEIRCNFETEKEKYNRHRDRPICE